MSTDRRGFFRSVGAVFAFVLGAPLLARGDTSALAIHQATRNTRWGALGVRLPKLSRAPVPYKAYPDVARVALPSPQIAPGLAVARVVGDAALASGFAATSLSLAELGRLLLLTNGVTGSMPLGDSALLLRAAPSAGALYAGEVYVAAERVEGLPVGVYYYGVAGHELVPVRSGASLAAVARALEQPGRLEGAAAVVLLSNVFGRYTWRYADRGYRYALIDTGHIGENLRLAAASAELAEWQALRFEDDALNALIGVDGRSEAVCALHALGRPGDARPARPPDARSLVEKRLVSATPEEGSAPQRYHEATKLVPGRNAGPTAPESPAVSTTDGPGLALEGAAAPDMPLEQAIQLRRSALHFRHESASRAALAFVLGAARGHPTARRADEVALLVAVHRVDSVPAGLYRVASDGRRLWLQQPGDLGEALVRACGGQEKAGEAAAALALVGRIAQAAERGSDRSYRDLLVEAGAMAQRVYLAAEAVGLAARNLAAFRDDELNALLGLDGEREAVVHLTVFGPGD